MLIFISDHLKLKKCVNMQLKELPFVIRYVPDQCKTQQMCDKVILENSGTLESVADHCKYQQICDKALEDHLHVLEFVPECYKTPKMCDKAVYKCPFVLDSVPDHYKFDKMCDKSVSEDPFKLKKNAMIDIRLKKCVLKPLIIFLPALKFVSDWFVTSKVIKNLLTVLCADDNILYSNENSGNAVFSFNEAGIVSIDLNSINLDNINYDEDDPETIIHIIILAWHMKFEKRKTLKKEVNGKIMLIA